MNYYRLYIEKYKVVECEQVDGVSPDYILYKGEFNATGEIYHNIPNPEITEVVCEAFNEQGAERVVTEWLDFVKQTKTNM